MNTFKMKTTIQLSENSLNCLKEYAGKRIFVVTDPYMVQSGLIKRVTEPLGEENCKIFHEIVPDPPIDLVTKGVALITEYQPAAAVALGGGSAIDAAKAMVHFAKKISGLSDITFIAIPTTSGTGSEVTSFAVISDPKKGIKYPLVSEDLLPDLAILDPDLVKSVPAKIAADTGMDVLTHAIEAYVSTDATDFTDALAEKAVQMVFQFLSRSCNEKDNEEAREKMHNASCIAGIAFNQASLGINHAIAHNIGGKLHLPHGRINAILLPFVIAFNADLHGYLTAKHNKTAQKYAELSRICGFEGTNIRMSVKNLIHEIIKLEKKLSMPLSLQECGIKKEDVLPIKEEIASGALADICMKTNPRPAAAKEIEELLYKIM